MTRTSKYELSGEGIAEFTGGTLLCGAGLYATAGASIDTRTIVQGQVYFAIHGPRFDGHDFVESACEKGAAGIVVSSSAVNSDAVRRVIASGRCFVVEVADTTEALISSARSWLSILGPRVIAITGSIGKTTTTALTFAAVSSTFVTHVTSGNYNNRLGVALTCLGLRPRHDVLVVEMGMNAPGEIAELCSIAPPDVAIVTTVAPVHLEGLKTIQGVAAAKSELVEALGEDGVAILNTDDPLVAAMASRCRGKVAWFGRDPRSQVRVLDVGCASDGATIVKFGIEGVDRTVRLKLVGVHNAMNAAAAILAAIHVGVDPELACSSLGGVEPGRHRMQLCDLGTIRMIDDCYNASPRSMLAALDALVMLSASRRKVAVLGDMLEMGEQTEQVHRDIGLAVAERGVALFIAVGRNAAILAESAISAGMDPAQVFEAQDSLVAAALAREILVPRDVVLVKASRGVGLELVTDAIRARFESRDVEVGN